MKNKLKTILNAILITIVALPAIPILLIVIALIQIVIWIIRGAILLLNIGARI